MKEKISVLMPVYNREHYVAAAIQGILKQTYENIDFLIFDDGSTDCTPRIILDYAAKDKRIRFFREEKNRGVPYARNQLITETKTGFACWQDSDDLSNIFRLEIQGLFAIKQDRGFICSNYEVYRNQEFDNDVIKSLIWMKEPDMEGKNKLGFATTMFLVDKGIKFDEKKILGGEDWDWMNRMQEQFGMPLFIKNKLYYIRFHNDRIGYWKRIILPRLGDLNKNNLSYEEVLRIHGHMG